MLFMTVALLVVFTIFIRVYNLLWLKPRRLRSKFSKQGIKGPPPSFLVGNIPEIKRSLSNLVKPSIKQGEVSHEWAPYLFPFFNHWTIQYGATFFCSLGNKQILYVSDHNMAKEIGLYTSLDLGKPTYQQNEHGPLLGQGILTSNGPLWAYQRKIMTPELSKEKVKMMHKAMVESATWLVNLWESKIKREDGGGGVADIRIDDDLRNFSADVISKACFGSTYSKGREIFMKLRVLQQTMSKKPFVLRILSLKYLPTKYNREMWRLEKEIRSLILKVVEERKQGTCEGDLLQTIIDGANNCDLGLDSIANFIIDNCKTIYFAGHESTAMSSCWTLLLLASNPDWQARVRDEVLEVCGDRFPDPDMFHKMKLLTMVIQESLRLYPAVFLSRQTLQDIKFAGIQVPKGVNILIPVIALHRDTSLWGPDVDEFKPERFANGISGACKVPQLYVPFGAGPRICAGQNLAMVELKLLLSQIISKFSFSVSPKYRHSPVVKFVLEPEHEVNLLMKRI